MFFGYSIKLGSHLGLQFSVTQFCVRCLHLKTGSSPHQIQNTNTKMIEREEKDRVWYEKKKDSGVLIFYVKKIA